MRFDVLAELGAVNADDFRIGDDDIVSAALKPPDRFSAIACLVHDMAAKFHKRRQNLCDGPIPFHNEHVHGNLPLWNLVL
jgi:hypothetical protein